MLGRPVMPDDMLDMDRIEEEKKVLEVDGRDGSFGIEEAIKQKPDGTEVKVEKINNDLIVVHVAVPEEIPETDVVSWLKDFKQVLPENAYLTILPKTIELNVHRPRKISLNFRDSTFETKDVMQSLKKTFEMVAGGGEIELNFKDCKFMKKRKGVEKDGSSGEGTKIITP